MAQPDDMRPVRSRRWLLVEQPGPWGSPDIRDTHMDAARADELTAWARSGGWELRAIRRGARRYRCGERTCFVVEGGRRDAVMRRHLVSDVARIMELPLSPPAVDSRWAQAVYAVGARPRRGLWRIGREQSLLGAFRDIRPQDTWEIAQPGDASAAASVAVFPSAAVYDRVGPASAPGIVAAHERGDLALEWWRGRACDAWEVRVAEHLVRRATGRTRLTDLGDPAVTPHGDDEATVAFSLDGAGAVEVRVRRSRADEIGRPVCSGACGAAERYELVSMRVASDERARAMTASSVA